MADRALKRRYLIAVFLGAFLLFLVQPLAGKRVLPRFGGGAGVWTTCMLSFQTLLLGGYAYAFALQRWLGRRGRVLHLILLVGSAAALWFFTRPDAWSAGAGSEDPTRAILIVLAQAVGLPYLLLASTGPLLQSWLASRGASVYRLYALSNVASFLALLSYPVLIEPWLSLRMQSWTWAALYLAYAAMMAFCALDGDATQAAPDVPPTAAAAKPSRRAAKRAEHPPKEPFVYWILLAACGSVLLLSITNHICQEVAVIPFLWVLPLAVYLATFAVCFDHERWYHRQGFAIAAVILIPLSCWSMSHTFPVWQAIAIDIPTLAVCCMICHGELARSKPAASRLTVFYLWLSAGGVLGGLLVAIVAPRVFSDFNEFPLALALCAVLCIEGWRRGKAFTSKISWVVAVGQGGVAIFALVTAAGMPPSGNRLASRNFYGVLRVVDVDSGGVSRRELVHGRTMHGFQLPGKEAQRLPTAYFGEPSGVGLAIANDPARASQPGLKIGVVGLGIGTIAALTRPGDTIRFYEINPDVVTISEKWFTYRLDSRAKVETVLGDARVQLENEAARGELQNFDILAIDAFNSDSIPVHLLTKECADLYRRHLKPDGVLLFHISNRAVDLAPEARALGQHLGWRAERVNSAGNNERLSDASWMLLSVNPAFWRVPEVSGKIDSATDNKTLLWTDDSSSVWRALRF